MNLGCLALRKGRKHATFGTFVGPEEAPKLPVHGLLGTRWDHSDFLFRFENWKGVQTPFGSEAASGYTYDSQ